MVTTSLFPQPVHSLPSPTPSVVAFPSTDSSVTNIDDLALPELIEQPGTLSPPESFAAAEDTREDEDPTVRSNLGMGFIDRSIESDEIFSVKPKRRLPRTYKDKKEKKRALFDEESYDSKSDASSNPPPAKRIKVVGLKNLGNTCYNNAVIQALSHTKPLRDYFLERQTQINDKENVEGGRKEDAVIQVQMHMARPRTRRAAQLEEQITVPRDVNLCDEFSRLLKLMWNDELPCENVKNPSRPRRISKSSPVVSPHAFATAVAAVLPLFQERYEQHDAQEFLRCSLERMQNELITENIKSLDEPSPSELNLARIQDTIVQLVFGGILWNKIVCLSCEEYTIKPDPFLDLSLVIPDLSLVQAASKSTDPQKTVTIEDCLDLFSSAEELEGSPSPPMSAASSTNGGTGRSCLSCGSDTGFSKAFKFGELPQVLCIHLKRFRWRRNAVHGGKLKVDTHVKFPLDGLDMGRWMDETKEGEHSKQLYDLYAVVVHQGSGANSGHYYAYIKYQNEWYHLNDDRAKKVTSEVVAKAKAYLLFYRKQETRDSTEAPGQDPLVTRFVS